MRFLGYVCVFAVLGGALVSCSDDDVETPGPGDATGGAADAGAPATTGGSTPTGGRPATTGGVAVNGGEAGAESATGGASDGGTSSGTGGAGEAGDTSAPGGNGGSGDGGEDFPSSCGKLLGFSECDPVSGFPCDIEAGDTCDFEVMLGAYACFPGPNDAVFCGGCDPELDQFCGAGTTCNFDYLRCEHYCCDDSDCASGTCLRNPFDLEDDDEAALAGVCATEAEALCTSSEGGASSSGGAGGASSEDAGGSGGAG